MKFYIKSIDPETGRVTVTEDRDGNTDQVGYLCIRPGGMVVFEQVDEREPTIIGYDPDGELESEEEAAAAGPRRTEDPVAQREGISGPIHA